MSVVTTRPEALMAAAGNLQGIGPAMPFSAPSTQSRDGSLIICPVFAAAARINRTAGCCPGWLACSNRRYRVSLPTND